jgi:hypothetical protein
MLTSSGFFADLFDLPWHLAKGPTSAQTAPPSTQNDGPSESGVNPHPFTASTPLTLDEVIDIDLATSHLQLFFDFMQLTARFNRFVRSIGFETNVEEAHILLPLIRRFDCELMRSSLNCTLIRIAWHQPWEILHFACDHDDVELGRAAISEFYYGHFFPFIGSDRSTVGWTNLKKLSQAWQSEFLRLLLRGSKIHDTILVMEIDLDNDK